jgi:EmrB/QacA subfamily drug resistance transporter
MKLLDKLFKRKQAKESPLEDGSVPASSHGTSSRWVALSVVLLAAFMDLLDVTIVNVAIPSIQHGLGTDYAAIQWVMAGYTLAFAIFLITGGRLGDIFGHKKMFLTGMAGFILASLLCGIAGTAGQLIGARVFQGIMASLMIPQIMSSIMVLFHSSKERLTAMSLYGAIAGIATVAGPIVGGLLIEGNPLGLEWRSVFLVNIPVGLVALAMAVKYLPNSKSPHPLKLDWIGMGLVTAALFTLLFPVVQGREQGWPVWGFGMMALSAPLLVAFLRYERYKTKKDGSPLMVLELFHNKAFSAGMVIMLLFLAALSGYFLFITLFMQVGLGYSALIAGISSVPFSLGVGVATAKLAAKLLPTWGRRTLHLGALLLVAGMLGIAGTLEFLSLTVSAWHLVPSFFIGGVGMGLIIAPLYNFVIAGVAHKDAGSASGILNAAHQAGGAIGIAVLGVLFFGLLNTNAAPSFAKVEPGLRTELQAAHVPEKHSDILLANLKTCFVDRSNSEDQSIEPASCKEAKMHAAHGPELIAQKVDAAARNAAVEANTHNFLTTTRQVLLTLAGMFAIIFGLVFLLPKKTPEHGAEEAVH